MGRRTFWVATALLLAGLLLTACGGSGSPQPEVSISNSDGTVTVGEGSELPASWPSDIPVPDGLRLQSVVDSGGSAVALYLGPGNADQIGSDVNKVLRSNGYEEQGTVTDAGEEVTTYLKGSVRVDVSVGQTGSDAAITISVEGLS
jgi:hypothetical protein